MEYQVSARRFRPQLFEDVIGQAHVERTLTNALKQGRVAHAYLFAGPRGVGKTTMARILAKALNCETAETGMACGRCPRCEAVTIGNHPDVIEIDGASNRGIDEVRELREVVKYAPMQGRYKVYIIDEVHMLTKEAFNALLKTLEEPPPHVVFVFATTESHRLPMTILSRCQQFLFRRLTRSEIVKRLSFITSQDGLTLSPRGLDLIATAADGSLRDALSLLDQAVSYSGKAVGDQELREILGGAGRERLTQLRDALLDRDTVAAIGIVRDLVDEGREIRQYATDFVEELRHLVVARFSKESDGLIDRPDDEQASIRAAASRCSAETAQQLFGIFSRAVELMRVSPHPRFVLEFAIIRATELPPLETLGRLVDRLEALEGRVQGTQVMTESHRAAPSRAVSAPEPVFESPRPAVKTEPLAAPPTFDEESQAEPISAEGPDAWAAVVSQLIHEKPNLASYLEAGQPVVAGDSLTLEFEPANAFAVNMIQKGDNEKLIRAIAAERFGRPMAVRFVVAKGTSKPRAAVSPAAPTPDLPADSGQAGRKKALMQESLADPVVKSALDLFGGELVDVNDNGPQAGSSHAIQ